MRLLNRGADKETLAAKTLQGETYGKQSIFKPAQERR